MIFFLLRQFFFVTTLKKIAQTITRLHPQGRWPEGPPSAAHVSLCLTFGTLKLHSSPLKPSKSGPQNLKNTYFWDLETPFFAPETFKIWSQNLKIVHFWVPFLDRILNVSRAKFGVSRSQKELKMTQKCPNCFGIVRTDRQTDRHRRTRTDRRTWKFWTTTQ